MKCWTRQQINWTWGALILDHGNVFPLPIVSPLILNCGFSGLTKQPGDLESSRKVLESGHSVTSSHLSPASKVYKQTTVTYVLRIFHTVHVLEVCKTKILWVEMRRFLWIFHTNVNPLPASKVHKTVRKLPILQMTPSPRRL